jgi:hypothetical protein
MQNRVNAPKVVHRSVIIPQPIHFNNVAHNQHYRPQTPTYRPQTPTLIQNNPEIQIGQVMPMIPYQTNQQMLI